jgi:NAD(P)-dependent dehydrogenase (short-subunit alcohol dehydrogenase family)
MELDGKICLVTGASRGIGRATAQALTARGAVVAAAATAADGLEDLGAASVHAADLSDPAEAGELAAAVLERHGRVDVLVNNAGIRLDALVHKTALDDLDRAFQVNAVSPFVLAGRLAGPMAERGEGVVATVVAPAVTRGRRGLGAYAASKAPLEALTQTLRQEVGGRGVAVFAFDPGWVRTPLAPDGPGDPAEAAARLVGHVEAARGSRAVLT